MSTKLYYKFIVDALVEFDGENFFRYIYLITHLSKSQKLFCFSHIRWIWMIIFSIFVFSFSCLCVINYTYVKFRFYLLSNKNKNRRLKCKYNKSIGHTWQYQKWQIAQLITTPFFKYFMLIIFVSNPLLISKIIN